MPEGNVRFIRKNGRVIPIRSKKPKTRKQGVGERSVKGLTRGAAFGAVWGGAEGVGIGLLQKKRGKDLARFAGRRAKSFAIVSGIAGSALNTAFGPKRTKVKE